MSFIVHHNCTGSYYTTLQLHEPIVHCCCAIDVVLNLNEPKYSNITTGIRISFTKLTISFYGHSNMSPVFHILHVFLWCICDQCRNDYMWFLLWGLNWHENDHTDILQLIQFRALLEMINIHVSQYDKTTSGNRNWIDAFNDTVYITSGMFVQRQNLKILVLLPKL